MTWTDPRKPWEPLVKRLSDGQLCDLVANPLPPLHPHLVHADSLGRVDRPGGLGERLGQFSRLVRWLGC